MITFDAKRLGELLPVEELISALRQAFADTGYAPQRQVVQGPSEGGERLLLLMPAFAKNGMSIAKVATIYPERARKGAPTVQGALIAFSEAGTPIAVMDAAAITCRRTAAASALAYSYLAREDSSRLAVAGTGTLSPFIAQAHASVRPLKSVQIWGHDLQHAAAAAAKARTMLPSHISVTTMDNLDAAVADADIVSCATNSATPILRGRALKAGAFVDLIGSFSPERREADDDVVRGARIFVDTIEGALSEAGDLLIPLASGAISRGAICGDLSDLATGRQEGRLTEQEIIVFKSVGTAFEDLAAAQLALKKHHQAARLVEI